MLGEEGIDNPVEEQKVERAVLLTCEREVAQEHELRRARVVRVLLLEERLEREPPEPAVVLACQNGPQRRELLLRTQRHPQPLRENRQQLHDVRPLRPSCLAYALEGSELAMRHGGELNAACRDELLESGPDRGPQLLPVLLLDLVEAPEELLQRSR